MSLRQKTPHGLKATLYRLGGGELSLHDDDRIVGYRWESGFIDERFHVKVDPGADAAVLFDDLEPSRLVTTSSSGSGGYLVMDWTVDEHRGCDWATIETKEL